MLQIVQFLLVVCKNFVKLPCHFDPNAQNVDIRHHKVNLFPVLCIFSMFLKQFSFQKNSENKLEQTKYVHPKCINPNHFLVENVALYFSFEDFLTEFY